MKFLGHLLNLKTIIHDLTSTEKNYKINLQIFFLKKIEKIMDIFEGNDKYSPPIRPCTKLLNFEPLTEEQVLNLINQMHYTTCAMDPM